MFGNFLKIIVRNLLRNKGFAVINIFGLSLGISCVLFIGLYIANELSYEKHFQDSALIYRVALHRVYPDREKRFASTPVMLAPSIKEKIPEIESATRLHRLFFQDYLRVEINDRLFRETHFFFADSNFFKVFKYSFIEGSPAQSLHNPTDVILTESTARRYFGRTKVLGELIKMDTVVLKVTGVVNDQPATTHIQFDLLGSIELLDHLNNAVKTNDWILAWVYTYVKTKSGTISSVLEKQIQGLTDEAGAASIAARFGAGYKKEGHRFNYFLQPLEKIHLYSNLDAEVEPGSNILFIYLLSVVAIIILIITIINFVNLSISKMGERAKEVGIRKTLGANDNKIRFQCLGETMLVCLVSALISCFLVLLMWTRFSSLIGKSMPLLQVVHPIYFFYLLILLIVVAFIAGFYPATIYGSLQPSHILSGELKTGKRSIRLRSVLMITQFSIAIAMITGSVAVLHQMEYVARKDLGFSDENVMIIRQTQVLDKNYKSFVDKLRDFPFVENAGGSVSTAVPGSFLGSAVFEKVGTADVSDVRANTTTMGSGFIETLHLKLSAGRAFSEQIYDSSSVIINESAVRAFELHEPIGSRIRNLTNKMEFVVVGVVSDYHFFSLHSPISPLIISKGDPNAAMSVVAVKLIQGASAKTIHEINKTWSQLSHDPFEFSLLREDLSGLYTSDRTSVRIFNVFTVIAIFLSVIGLLGLTSSLAQQQLKALGIRRVLGATRFEVAYVFATPFFKMTLYSLAVAFASSFWAINQWLNTFSYHESLSPVNYGLVLILAFAILLISLGAQFVRLMRINVVRLLKEN